MKNILIFAGFAGIAAAIAIYFTTEGSKKSAGTNYLTDADIDEYDKESNFSPGTSRGYNAMS